MSRELSETMRNAGADRLYYRRGAQRRGGRVQRTSSNSCAALRTPPSGQWPGLPSGAVRSRSRR